MGDKIDGYFVFFVFICLKLLKYFILNSDIDLIFDILIIFWKYFKFNLFLFLVWEILYFW